jgi:glycosyltransferase involved in cell wall biosynthesis
MISPLKILFLSTWFPHPPNNGSKTRVHHLLQALARRHEVTLLSFAFDTARPEEARALRDRCVRVETVPCNPLQRGPLARALRFLSPRPVVAAPIGDMARLVRRASAGARFDAAIASAPPMATYALQFSGAARVMEEHNSMTRWLGERYQAQRLPLQRLRCWASWQKNRAYEAWLYRRFDLCTVVCEQDRRACLDMLLGYRGPVEVVPNGVDCDHNRPGMAANQPGALVYNGALTYSANYDAMQHFLAEIYPRIRRQAPGVSLTITGSLDGVDLSGLALDPSVRLSGYVEDVRPLVAGAELCVVPLRQGGGTRLKILEAMALGTPVVATSKGAEGLKVVDGEHLALADDPALFAARTVALLRDRLARERLAAAARRRVEERYDWRSIGERFVDLVERAAERRREER